MCRIMDIMILREGYRFLFRTNYKSVDNCSQMAEIQEGSLENFYPVPLNQYEYENLLQREKSKPDSFPLEEIDSQYLTKTFKLEKISTVEKVSKYLLTVLDLAENILKKLTENVSVINQLKNADLKEDGYQYQIIKNSIKCFLEIFCKTRIARKSICNSKASNMAGKFFDQLESDMNLIFSLSPVPDELVVYIGETFPNITLIKFSDQKKAGLNDKNLTKAADEMCVRLYSAALNFVRGIIDEFSFYMSPEEFINNPGYSALFVIPDDMYTSFNFSQGGLCRFEIQPLDTVLNYKKTVFRNTLAFYDEVRTYLEKALNISKQISRTIKVKPDDNIFERFLQEYKDEFLNTTEGKVKDIEEMIKTSAGFREKVTALLVIMNSDMLGALNNHEKPWGHERKTGESLNNLYVLNIITTAYFGKEKMLPQSQFQRVFSIFNEYSNPSESVSHNCRAYRDGKLKWRKADKEQFMDLLMN